MMDVKGLITNEPVQILDMSMSKKGNQFITQVLIQWSNSYLEDVTWESLTDIHKFLILILEDKDPFKGEVFDTCQTSFYL